MNRRISAIPRFAVLLVTWCAATAHAATPGEDALCHNLEAVRSRASIPGMTAAVSRSDGSLIEFALGSSAGAVGADIKPGDKFLSGSIGKTYAASLAIDLHNRGILDLDAPLSKLLGGEPWYKALPNACCITLRQLLNHSSGMPTHVELPSFQKAISDRIQKCADCLFTPLEAVKMLDGAKPLFPPGQGFAYSETGYLVAGFAIEKASGRPYYVLLKERLLVPLKLIGTVPSDRNSIPGLVSGSIAPRTNYFGLNSSSTMESGKLLYNPGLEWTGGGVAASSADLARWGRALYTGHALADPYLHELFTSVPDNDGHGGRYGLGVGISGHGSAVSYGHTGSIPGYRSALRYFPARGVTVAVQINADPDDDESILKPIVEIMLAAADDQSLFSGGAYTPVKCAL